MQLPPTAFFSSDAPDEEDDSDELLPFIGGTQGFESILDALGSLLPFRMLQWHYRSRDDRLIAFSNAHIYNRLLTTFAGVGRPPLTFAEAPWDPTANTNSPGPEVAVVVELIIEHARVRPNQTLGVIPWESSMPTR